ncbi:PREDICTED: uncharacterized protein LOC103325085 [Prunus mume]|uniref:Uncharacterized protein LOC103325085 n=1 Tax=Prunus mume TaxID=102107 RepID=A0ABM0NIU5_PRUMU|nr:PREDICTED: uncharacterized protein LOC103325085 [Prunus mume]
MFPNSWTTISDKFKGSRTPSQCQIRHQRLFPLGMPVPIFNPDGAIVGQSPDLSPDVVAPANTHTPDLDLKKKKPILVVESKSKSESAHTPDLDLKKKKPILVVESKSKSESALYCLRTLCRNVKVADHLSKASSSTKVDPKLGKKRRIDDVKQPLLHSPEPEPEPLPGLKEIGIFGSTRMKPSEMQLVETLTRGLLSEGFHIVTVSIEMGTCKAVMRGLAEAHCTVLPNERDAVARVQRIVAFAYRNSTIVLAACAHAKAEGKEALVFYLD